MVQNRKGLKESKVKNNKTDKWRQQTTLQHPSSDYVIGLATVIPEIEGLFLNLLAIWINKIDENMLKWYQNIY